MVFCLCKEKTAYEVRISDWSSDVCSSDLLADHAGRIEPGEPRDVDRRLGVAGANQNAAVDRDQRKDMAGGHDVVAVLPGVDRDRPGARAVGGRNAGIDALARLDRGERKSVV